MYYFVTVQNDTVRCKKIDWSVDANSTLKSISYTTLEGKKKLTLKGKGKFQI